jgi:hypothetical protein
VINESAIRQRYEALAPVLDEQSRRRFAAAEAASAGHGGVSAVMRATGIARSTIGRGLAELRAGKMPDGERTRRPGGGRKPMSETDASLLDYRLQANRKTREGSHNPDRDAQFHYLNDRVKEALARGEPAISIDTKKKELVGDFKNAGREWRPKGSPEEVRVHDFVIPELGRAVPYGVYDIAGNAGWVSVGIDHDTAAFAANAIRSWWRLMGRARYPNATSLLITADGGGSNGSRVRLWKIELQRLVDELGIPITVCHLPPGTSKWNKIEHRLFSFITGNWRGKPLVSHQVIVQLIAATTTSTGLKVRCELDQNTYPAGIKVSDAEMDAVNLTRHDFHGEWNYTVTPKARALER